MSVKEHEQQLRDMLLAKIQEGFPADSIAIEIRLDNPDGFDKTDVDILVVLKEDVNSETKYLLKYAGINKELGKRRTSAAFLTGSLDEIVEYLKTDEFNKTLDDAKYETYAKFRDMEGEFPFY